MEMKAAMKLVAVLGLALAANLARGAVPPPAPCGPLPNERQLWWQDLETYAFIHYSLNTYTDQEWGYGNEDPKLFNPAKLDARQWARVCRESGMKGAILTAKHRNAKVGSQQIPGITGKFGVQNEAGHRLTEFAKRTHCS